jgi:hypothetical protein
MAFAAGQADEPATPLKNYITRSGLQRLKDEHRSYPWDCSVLPPKKAS